MLDFLETIREMRAIDVRGDPPSAEDIATVRRGYDLIIKLTQTKGYADRITKLIGIDGQEFMANLSVIASCLFELLRSIGPPPDLLQYTTAHLAVHLAWEMYEERQVEQLLEGINLDSGES